MSENIVSNLIITEYLNTLIKYSNNLDQNETLIFRGQADSSWNIQSGAARRLMQQNKKTQKEFLEYHVNLIETARNVGDYENTIDSKDLCDLEVLAEIQHFGGATCLIDFSLNVLVALWFASNESSSDSLNLNIDNSKITIKINEIPQSENFIDKYLIRSYDKKIKINPYETKAIISINKEKIELSEIKKNNNTFLLIKNLISKNFSEYLIEDKKFKFSGKLFAINSLDERIYSINKKREENKIVDILKQTQNNRNPFYKGNLRYWFWNPTKLNNRIIKQDSVFLFSMEQFSLSIIKTELEIRAIDKLRIKTELKKYFGICIETVFNDLPGFSNDANSSEMSISNNLIHDGSCIDAAKDLIKKEEFQVAEDYLNKGLICSVKNNMQCNCFRNCKKRYSIELIYFERALNTFRQYRNLKKIDSTNKLLLKSLIVKAIADFERVCFFYDQKNSKNLYFNQYPEIINNPFYYCYNLYADIKNYKKARYYLDEMRKIYSVEESIIIDFAIIELEILSNTKKRILSDVLIKKLDEIEKTHPFSCNILTYYFSSIVLNRVNLKSYEISDKQIIIDNKLKFHSDLLKPKSDIDLAWNFEDMEIFLNENKYPLDFIILTNKIKQLQSDLMDIIFYERNPFSN